jgi:hypothetical protein
MAEGKTSPWLIGGIAIGSAVVFYFLYSEYRASLAAAANASSVNPASATSNPSVIDSAIAEQEPIQEPSYPTTATVTSSGTVVGENNPSATGEPGGSPTPNSNTTFQLPSLPSVAI